MKTFIKKKSAPNSAGPKYRTPDFFKGSKFGSGKQNRMNQKFNLGQFKIQHKG